MKIKNILLLIWIYCIINSCSDSNQSVEESPFFDFFNYSNIRIDTQNVLAKSWEYGFVFETLKKGEITKLGIKLPSLGEFTVRLWDFNVANPMIIHEEKISINQIHQPVFINIDHNVSVQSKLGISVIANSLYNIQRSDSSEFIFPIKINNISILSFNESEEIGGTSNFSTNSNNLRVAPCVNVIFIAE